MRKLHLLLPILTLALSTLALPGCDLFGGKDGGDEDGEGDDGGDGDDADNDGYSVADGDCDDGDPWVNPGETEYCDGVDNDCDSLIDEDDSVNAITWYVDQDGDDHGTPDDTTEACNRPDGYSSSDDDCDDNDANRYPGNDETCDGKDNDCDADIDEDVTTALYEDADRDGFGNPLVTEEGCTETDGWVFDATDCDDTSDRRFPGNTEVCDDLDNDCNSLVDDDTVDGAWYATDLDGDGMGETGSLAWLCEGVDNEWDCNDTDPTEPQVVDADSIWASGDGSLDFPHQTLQAGIEASSECVVAFGGTYNEAIEFGGRNIKVTGVEGAENTIIDGSGTGGPAVTFDQGERTSATLQGFTLYAGDGYVEEESESTKCNSTETCTDYYLIYCGGGLFIDGADPTIVDVIIDSNVLPAATTVDTGNDVYYYSSLGGGACLLSSNATLDGVSFVENFADQGGALYIDDYSAVELSRSSLFANSATDGGAIQVDGGTLIMNNVLTAWNEADQDGGAILLIDAVLDSTNATIARDQATAGSGIYASGISHATLINSIVADTVAEGILVDAGASYLGSYDNVYGNGTDYSGVTDPTGVSGNIGADPRFRTVTDNDDWTDDDWSLSATSPSVDAGNPAAAYDDVDGTTNDQGAYGGPYGAW